jgi:ferritin-like protein
MIMKKNEFDLGDFINKPIGREGFLKYTGAALATTGLLLAGCKKDKDPVVEEPPVVDTGVNLGSGDTGILNYAYALEQLEAAFYIKVMASPYTNMQASEAAILNDIKNHEIGHRDFFKAALGTNAIQGLEVNFSAIDFTSRTSVLNTAKAFEDLGVSAYNGSGKLISDVNYLLLAGKIVSVEARHAAAIRSMLNPGSADFSGDDVVDGNGLDKARTPTEVLSIAGSYISTKINASNLPS